MKTNLFGGLMSSENMVEILMNMMQNPCPKHAQDHPHVVSSVRQRKKRFSSKTFNNSHSPIVLLLSSFMCVSCVGGEILSRQGYNQASRQLKRHFPSFHAPCKNRAKTILHNSKRQIPCKFRAKTCLHNSKITICKNRANNSLHNSLSRQGYKHAYALARTVPNFIYITLLQQRWLSYGEDRKRPDIKRPRH